MFAQMGGPFTSFDVRGVFPGGGYGMAEERVGCCGGKFGGAH